MILLTGIFLFSGMIVVGQKLKSGDVLVLKVQSLITLQFYYSKATVGRFKTEDEYIAI